MRCGALGGGLPARQASSWSPRDQIQVFLQPEVRQRTSRSAMAPKSPLHALAHPARRLVGEAGGVGLDLLVGAPGPLVLAAVDAAADRAVLELAVDALALRAARGGRAPARRRARPASSCALRENTDLRVQPGDRAGDRSCRPAPASFASQPAHRFVGGGALVANAASCAVDGPGPGPVAARAIAGALDVGRLRRTSRGRGRTSTSRVGGVGAPRPPSLGPLGRRRAKSRCGCTRARSRATTSPPDRSASVNPATPMNEGLC